MATKSSIDQLNTYLRGEMAAVETYHLALRALDEISTARDELLINLKSHQDRVASLQDAIIDAGGMPATSSGPWGTLAKAAEGTAEALGEKAAIAVLEEGEDHGLADYQDDLDKLDPETRYLVAHELLPQQQITHNRATALKRRMH
jgi:hypothetical protein